MHPHWYVYLSEGKVRGPLSSAELKRQAELGHLRAQHRVRNGPEGNWVHAGTITGLLLKAVPNRHDLSTDAVLSPSPTMHSSGTRKQTGVQADVLIAELVDSGAMSTARGAATRSDFESTVHRVRKRTIIFGTVVFSLIATWGVIQLLFGTSRTSDRPTSQLGEVAGAENSEQPTSKSEPSKGRPVSEKPSAPSGVAATKQVIDNAPQSTVFSGNRVAPRPR